MRDFFVPKDLLLFSNKMEMNSDFSIRGFSGGLGEAMGTLTVTVSSAEAQPWTPAEISSAQWLDYGDDDTRTWDVGLSVLADKSGNGRNAVMPTSTAQPIDSSGLLQFTTSHYMTHSVPQALPCHIFWVIDCSAMGTGARTLMDRTAQSAPYPPGIYAGGTVNYQPNVYWGSGWTGNGGIGAINGGLMILECVLTSQYVQFRKNGGTLFSVSHSNSALSSWNATPIDYGPQALAHKMGERIIVNASVETSVRQKIEGCLAHKWDNLLGVSTLVSALPSDHPYKSAAPTI